MKMQEGVDNLQKIKNCNVQENMQPHLSRQNPVILPKYEELYSKNKDLVGWVKITGTPIDYPVVQKPGDEDYYLTHGFDGEKNINGLPVLDAACDFLKPGTNLIIHGHNMKNGQMFASLHKYKGEKFYREHSVINFDTLYGQGEYEIIAVFLSRVYKKNENVFKFYQFTEARNKEEFDKYINNIKELSLYDTGVTAEYGDELITLSTCSYHTENGRIAVVAKKIKSKASESAN